MTELGRTAIIVMGVAGSGKSTIAVALAAALQRPMLEGDELHPAANVEKMSKGIPLDDNDRAPWLNQIAARIDEARRAQQPIVVTCSALKRSYRAILTGGHDDVGFVYLKGTKDQLSARLKTRKGHFMPPALLDSQLATLEEPGPDERAIRVAIDAPPTDIVRMIVEKIGPREQ